MLPARASSSTSPISERCGGADAQQPPQYRVEAVECDRQPEPRAVGLREVERMLGQTLRLAAVAFGLGRPGRERRRGDDARQRDAVVGRDLPAGGQGLVAA